MKTQSTLTFGGGAKPHRYQERLSEKSHSKLLLHIRSTPAPQVKASEETRTPCPPGAPHLAPLLLPGQAPGGRALALSRPAAHAARAPPRQGPQMSSPPRGASRSQRSQGPDSTGRRRPRPLPARPEGSSPRTPEPGSCPPKARRSLESFHSLSLSLGTRGARARGGKAAVSAPTRETTGRGGGGGPRAGPRA